MVDGPAEGPSPARPCKRAPVPASPSLAPSSDLKAAALGMAQWLRTLAEASPLLGPATSSSIQGGDRHEQAKPTTGLAGGRCDGRRRGPSGWVLGQRRLGAT